MTIPGWSSTRQLFGWVLLFSVLSNVQSQQNEDTSADSTEPVVGTIRLINGTESSGRLEIFYEGEWGTICNDGWGKTEADVVCKNLGFGDGEPLKVSAGSGKIFLAEVRCKGDEKSVVECSNNKFEPHECTHETDAGVICNAALNSLSQSNSNNVDDCNFEYGTCGFRVSSLNSYQWIRRYGSTPSSSTGPSSDHTYGSSYDPPTTPGYRSTTRSSGYRTTPGYRNRTTYSGYRTTPGYRNRTTYSGYPTKSGYRNRTISSGYYMYTEASSGSAGASAELISDLNSRWIDGLSFWYHMYGATIGTLNVIITTDSGNKKVIWSKKYQQGNYWQHACIMVTDYVSRLTFEGIRGSSYTGDIAIDDIQFVTGSCTSNENGTCTFQNGACGYQTIPGNTSTINWNLISGASYQAPIYDHSTQKSTGRYLSLNSYGTEGMRNYFLSPPIQISEEMKVEFYYYMAGYEPGELQVSFRDSSTPMDSWTKNDWQDFGDHGNRWNYGCMELHKDTRKNVTSKRILFTGITGSLSGIKLALDDITITNGSCGVGISSHKCTFENPKLCDYKINCTAHQEYTWRRTTGQTSSYNTGPTLDASQQRSGYYLYAEGSYGKAGDAVSVTFPVKKSKGKFLKFNYHMYGQSMGSLLLRYSSGKSINDVWTISGNQGSTWMSSCLKIDDEIDAVVFIAVRGYKFTSDIALDNVILDTKPCPNAVNCDFENGMCNYTIWMSNISSRFQWYRTRGIDHTHGNGYYTYISNNYGEGHWTSMTTTDIKQSSNTSSLQFYYNPYNIDSSKLMVQLNRLSGVITNNLTEPKFFKMDVEGWVMGCINIPPNVMVSANFTAVSGTTRGSQIMLDDIYYNEYPCVVGIVNNECTFDEPNVCGYNVSCREATQYLWKRKASSTRSVSTGPFDDNTAKGNGYYMYTESTLGSPGDVTDLEFPEFVTPTGHYLSFYYHMFGRDIGTLEVNTITRFGKTLKWIEKGNIGNRWLKGCINLPFNEMTTVVFTGIRGNGPLGDIAIDDVIVEPGICYPQSIACDFQDEMICGYRNISSSSNMGWFRRKSGSGYYISPSTQSGNHRLRSPLKNITDSCIQISYKITGTDCTLDVYTSHDNQKKLSLHSLNSTSWELAQFHIDQAMTHLLIDANILYSWYSTCSIKINSISIRNGTCPNLVCSSVNAKKCADESQCIDNSLICDRYNNCPDKSDESTCSKSISCDFEDKYLCGYQFQYGWYHTQMDNFGNPDLHLNNSAYSMSLNSGRSILTTPKERIKDSCLQFYYAGGTGSSLEVKAVYDNNQNYSMWNISFTHLTKWTVGQFELSAGNVALEFIGSASTLGLLLDNVKLQEGKCGKIACLNDSLACKSNEKCYSSMSVCNRIDDCYDGSDELKCPSSLACDVEHPYQCGYKYKSGTWSVESGISMLYPDLDHSHGLYSGHYFVSNFSYGNQSHDLKAPQEILSVESCLTFYYSFYGLSQFEIYDNGRLQLTIIPNNVNTWQKSQLQLNQGSHNITFTHRLHSNTSMYDVLALDSIGVSEGKCGVLQCEKGWRNCSTSPICVPESKFCDREKDCPNGEDEYNCNKNRYYHSGSEWTWEWSSYSRVRLVGGRNVNQGFVQFYMNNQWNEICGYWPERNADVVCRELGYNGTARTTFKTKRLIQTYSEIDSISCRGYESNLQQCSIRQCYGYCSCNSPAAVDCSDTQCESTHLPCQDYNATTSNSSSANTTCIPKESMCDGEKDCPGGTDELSCPKCQASEFQCLNYECIPGIKRCDGIKDCKDESDEYHCFKHDGVNLFFMMSGNYMPVCEDNLKDQDMANKICHFVGKGNASVGVSTVKTSGVKFFYSANLNQSVLPNFKPAVAFCQKLSLKCQQRECGSRSPNLYDPLIQHGHKALPGEFPWQVSLHYNSRFTCGGILIDEDYILTAAHCVDNGIASNYDVYVGSTLRYGGQKIRVSKIMAHKNFTMRYLRSDIAVLKLASPVTMTDYIRPACLPSQPWKPHTLCFASGWGRIEDRTSPNDLMETKLYTLSRDICLQHYRYSDDTTVCANHKQPNQPGCYGDSGGPMVCRNEQGYWEAVGIFSYGRVQCEGHDSSPQVFADVYTFRDWILNRMGV